MFPAALLLLLAIRAHLQADCHFGLGVVAVRAQRLLDGAQAEAHSDGKSLRRAMKRTAGATLIDSEQGYLTQQQHD